MIERQIPVEIADVFRRGFRILVDKDRLAERLVDRACWPEKADKLPTESMWRETGHDFLYHVLLAAKKARRGELWEGTHRNNLRSRSSLPVRFQSLPPLRSSYQLQVAAVTLYPTDKALPWSLSLPAWSQIQNPCWPETKASARSLASEGPISAQFCLV
jgi:hypothetical protein